MQCPLCAALNPAPARFCLNCGQPLVAGHVCPACYTLLPPTAQYCFHCGTQIIVAVGVPPAMAATPAAMVAEKAPLAMAPIGTSLADEFPALSRYLPAGIYEPLERAPAPADLKSARDHLKLLLSVVKTYLPWPVILAPQPPGEAAGGMRRGTFLFADVSGFTALSERLMRYDPKTAAGRLTEIMNSLFVELVGCLYDCGGSLLKFGGDALLGVFEAEDEAQMRAGALQAACAALAMQAVMEKFGAVEAAGQTVALCLKCGVCSGPYFAAHIGTAQNMGYVATGHTVNNTELCEDHAEAGETIISLATLELIRNFVEVKERAEGFYVLHACHGRLDECGRPPPPSADDDPPGDLPDQIRYLTRRLDRLIPYLAADLLPRLAPAPGHPEIFPESRPATVMFVNYVGLSGLIDDLGPTRPDLITGHLQNYFVYMAGIVEKYEGTLARLDHYAVGDRLVIFFGAPRAHEDDALRAVYTALEMQAATRKQFAALQTPVGVYRFRQRAGINSGYLFAGNVGAARLRQEYTLMGDDINMAARLMSKAGWDEIFISRQTKEYVATFIELESKGELKVKGKEIFISTFKVLGRLQTPGRARGLDTPTPMLGREREMTTALLGAETLIKGRGQILAVIAPSGVGKSRLMREFRQALQERFDGQAPRWLEAQALSFSEQVSYWLAAQLLYAALGLELDANPDDVLFTLWERGEEVLTKPKAREAVPFLAHLLDLKLEGEWGERVTSLDPKSRQKQTLWAVREFFIALARQQPTLIVLEDLHWADEASLALVDDLFAVTDRVPLMFCLVLREERDKGAWRLRDRAASAYAHRYVQLDLPPLSPADAERLLEELIPGTELAVFLKHQILEKAAGNPFYLKEVVRSLEASGAVVRDAADPGRFKITDQAATLAIPNNLHSAIVARLDRLAEDARRALQMAAVIGRRFQKEVLAGLAGAQAEVEIWLSQLERSGLVCPSETAGETVYTFPDALVQEVAYESLLEHHRREFHRQIGETLENIFAGREAQVAEQLASHYRRSNDIAKAVHYLELAGRKAQADFANETALGYYAELLSLLGEDESVWERRFAILDRRQQIYALLGRQTDREADLRLMLTLAETHQNAAARGTALNGLADLFQWTGRYEEALRAAAEALAIEQTQGDLAGQAAALHHIGVVHYYRGNYAEAEPALSQAARLRREVGEAAGESWSQLYLTMIHFVTGNYSTALAYNSQALEAAAARQDWMLMGIHFNNGARIAHRLGEYTAALELFVKSLELRERVGDRTGQGFTLFGMGLVYVNLERYAEAEAAFLRSQQIRQEIGDERGLSYGLYGLGLVALGRGALVEAETLLQQTRVLHEKLDLRGELVADLSWLGQVCLQQNRLPEAVLFSRRALELLADQKNVEEVQQIYFNHYRILKAQGDPEAAQYLERAQRAMRQQAEAIVDPGNRATFLDKVKVNHEIAAAVVGA